MNYESMKSTVQDALKNVFNPEFLNRIDDVIVFHALEKEHIFEIIDIMSADLFDRADEMGIDIVLERSAKEFLVEKGFDPKYGARPLQRAIQKYVEDPMAGQILNRDLGDGDTITVSHDGNPEESEELVFSIEEGEPRVTESEASLQNGEAASENGEAEGSAENGQADAATQTDGEATGGGDDGEAEEEARAAGETE
jgi:ATP-dependent Clp protease ATP-binding subunit ClpC